MSEIEDLTLWYHVLKNQEDMSEASIELKRTRWQYLRTYLSSLVGNKLFLQQQIFDKEDHLRTIREVFCIICRIRHASSNAAAAFDVVYRYAQAMIDIDSDCMFIVFWHNLHQTWVWTQLLDQLLKIQTVCDTTSKQFERYAEDIGETLELFSFHPDSIGQIGI